MSGFRFALVCTGVSVWLLCQECSLPAELNRFITRLLEPSFTSGHTVRESTYIFCHIGFGIKTTRSSLVVFSVVNG